MEAAAIVPTVKKHFESNSNKGILLRAEQTTVEMIKELLSLGYVVGTTVQPGRYRVTRKSK